MEYKGLNERDVNERIEKGQINVFENPDDLTLKKILKNNICTFFNLIIFILALLVVSSGAYKNLMFVGVAFCNMLIGIVQEVRAMLTLNKLNIIAEAKMVVIRNSQEISIPVSEIVLDDILHIKSGNQIVCDSIILEGAIEVNESLLTGEPDVIEKKMGDKLYSGSFIVAGDAYAQVIHVGKDNLSSKIMLKAKTSTKPKSLLQENIDLILKIVSSIILPLGLLLFATQFFANQSSYSDSIIGTVAGVSGMIPEGLVLLTSVSLALGVVALSKEKTLVHNIYCIETLAHVDVLCLDKTGTLTEGRMRVEKTYRIDDYADIDGMVRKILACLNDENATSQALRDYFGKAENITDLVRPIPFSSERKFSGAVYENETLLMGAIEFLFPDSEEKIKQIISTYTTNGMRVITLARSLQQMEGYQMPSDLKPIALIAISDCIRSNAGETLDYFKQQGVDIRIISGDAPETVSLIARRVGLEDTDNYVDASTFSSFADIQEAVQKYKIFGRVKPTQKKELIMALQNLGHTVGMTGDGVNDVMALKQADCSIAMAEGSEAAKQVSNIVLLDSDFSHMPSVLSEGRKVIHHIQNAASLFLVKTVFSVLITLMTMFTVSQYPFEPIQLTFIGTIAIGLPSLFLTLEKDYTLVSGKFLINVLSKSLPGSLTVFLEIILISIFCAISGYGHDVRSTMCVMMTTLCTMMVLKNVYPLNSFYRRLIFTAMSIVAIICLVFLHEVFEMIILNFHCLIVFVILSLLAYTLCSLLTSHMEKWLVWIDKKISQVRK
jgi:ATPase, P-type (transporting), HAD superfamily, subfamily IC/ATPase, P-type (transporting), HAD superfamily, subfamily IC